MALLIVICVASLAVLGVISGQGTLDQTDPYNVPYPGYAMQASGPSSIVMTNPAGAASALTTQEQAVAPDLDALLDLQDQVSHYPVHGTILMPRMIHTMRYRPQRRLGQGYPGKDYYGGMFAQGSYQARQSSMEDSYYPAQQPSDTMIVMVDDPVVLVGPPNAAGTTGAPATTKAAGK